MTTPRKVGRPRLDDDDESIPVTIRFPSKQYDKIYADAKRDRVTVSEWLRRRATDRDRRGDD